MTRILFDFGAAYPNDLWRGHVYNLIVVSQSHTKLTSINFLVIVQMDREDVKDQKCFARREEYPGDRHRKAFSETF